MKKNKTKLILLGSIFILLLGFILYFENTNIEITKLTIINSKIPTEFEGYRIAHISDLHNAKFGENNKKLLSKIEESNPDIIFITGDMIDANRTDIHVAVDFLERAIKIAPVYYVTGNHEASVKDYPALADTMESLGVNILDNICTELKIRDARINLIGLADPNFANDFRTDTTAIFSKYLGEMNIDSDNYTILLSHRPEVFDFYVQSKIDLVFSGHAHGGQVRLPFVGGMIAPNQGVFPAYTSGVYKEGDTEMIVSRGVGNSIIPIRINNNPEIIVVTLKTK